ncbi:ACR3 family arsenite efflux pump ArsB [Hydrogenophaga palleronii]|uniref:ACR3 family arsenite efflux pump ArsB n=1 Tax=Hydrogenophaga palleronii TaxID=65655 RepID=A0ABU1WNX7_9BURK|nr:arsenic resistance protein [Hydrogenophaga palleronii]MDR7150963.1 ACR3 family arsenite efflux pump ArsB [Hydrogenophaga palleronii]
MSRFALERHQVWVYLIVIGLGLAAGTAWPSLGPAMEHLLWPTLATLLFVTFLQVPLLHVRHALRDRRFAAAVLLGNFVMLPLLVWALVVVFDFDPVVRLGVLLVLLVPCTDWFITFSQLGKGDLPRAMAITPLNLGLQLVLLPLYLWLMTDAQSVGSWAWSTLAPAVLIVLAPLALAALAERWLETQAKTEGLRETLAWWPVPLLSLVVFLIAGAQVGTVLNALHELQMVLPVFVLFLVAAALLAKGIALQLRLPAEQGRTLAFSMGTRNSFVVLPLALLLPAGWEVVAVVIVVQSMVELFGMAAYVWVIPRYLFR